MLSLCCTSFPSSVMLILGVGVVLLTTIAFILMMFISIPYGLPALLNPFNSPWRSVGQKHSSAVSSAYLRLLSFMPPIVTFFMSCTSLNNFSVYKLKKLDERTHPCCTPFLILHSAVNPDSVLTTADCSKHNLVMILVLYHIFQFL